MRLLLDTHIFLWVVDDNPKLSRTARKLIRDADDVFVSSATIWEASIKAHIGKLTVDVQKLVCAIEGSEFRELPVRAIHAAAVRDLPDINRDPFDRILVAQSISEQLVFLTADSKLASYPAIVRLV